MGSSGPIQVWHPIPVAPRYTRRNAGRAMGGFVVRGLVELVTNSRDSGLRLHEGGVLSAQDLARSAIELELAVQGDSRRLVVRDRFEGMTASVMREKLIPYGNPASGFETGSSIRGINARGAKDVGSLGEVRFESVRDDQYAECVIYAGRYAEPLSRPVTSADRTRLGIPAGNGTVVTLLVSPDVTMPRFDALATDLDRHIELRYNKAGLPRIPLELREARRGGREVTLGGFAPEGSLLLEQDIPLPGFERYGGTARLRLFKSTDQLQVVGNRTAMTRFWRSEAGIMVVDGRTAHDITFFQARGSEDAAAGFLYGELFVPQVPQLLREFEDFERARETNPSAPANPHNPSQVTDPDRLGLNSEHPFVVALVNQVRPVVERVLAELQRELSPSAQDRVSAQLRAALERLGERLAERLEVGNSGPDTGSEAPLGLRLIPGGLRVEIGRAKRIGVYYRTDNPIVPDEVSVHLTASTSAIELSTSNLVLAAISDQVGLFRGSVDVIGRSLSELAVIQAQANGDTATARVSVREPTTGIVDLDRDLQFGQRRYTSTPGRRKKVELLADPTLADQDVQVSVSGEQIGISTTTVHLDLDPTRGVAAGAFFAESDSPVSDTLHARLGELSDTATIVFQPDETRRKIDFKFEQVADYGTGRRYKWDRQVPGLLKIAAQHPTLSRVLGPDLDAQGVPWPGQHSPQSKAILAELISDAYAFQRLNQELPSLGIGPENLVDPVEYESRRYSFFEECYLLCHESLTPAFSPTRS